MSSEGNKRALIVACDRYADPDLKQLQAPSQDAEHLAEILEDPKIGGFRVIRLIDEPYHTIKEKIEDFLQSTNKKDTILLYFSCHGIKDRNGQLYFATITTNRKRLYSTGIESNFVNNLLEQCRAKQKVLLLDCCYSGAFQKGRIVRADTQVNATEFFGRGTVVITASDAMQYAFEGDNNIKNLRKVGSYFTSALIEGLATGNADADKDGKITYHELYDYIYEHIREITPDQTPTLNTHGVEGNIVIFKNPNNTKDNPEYPSEGDADVAKQPRPVGSDPKYRTSKYTPLDVTIIAILTMIGGAIFVAGGIEAIGSLPEFQYLAEMAVETPYRVILLMLLPLGIAYLVMAYSLWKGNAWAWKITWLLSAIGIILGIVSYIYGFNEITATVSAIISGLIIYYLNRPNVKEFLGK